ncbi:MAG: carotenoid oxygenase family protein [Cyanobacteria bacterium J06597_1]
MVTTAPSPTSAWFPALDRPAQEFGPASLDVISGQIPSELNGRYFTNGTGRLQRGNERVGHWFDGDGAVLGVNFSAGEATGTYRYVKTDGYLAEEASGKYQYAGYGMGNSGPIWERFRPLKNAANTSVLAVDDRLLALWEGAVPHALDLDTLETQGLDTLGSLSNNTPFSAHPKRDPVTGDIYNFGSNLGAKDQLFLFRCDRSGTVKQRGIVPLSRKAYVHDFILAGPYLVFVLSPVTLNVWPILFKQHNFCDCLEWKPDYGTDIVAVDRQTFEVVSRTAAEPWYQWHFGNGFVGDDGTLTFDTVRYPDFQTNEFLRQVPTGVTPTYSLSTLWQVRLDPKNGKFLGTEQLCDRHCEFPTLAPQDVGQPHRYTYLAIHPDNESAPGELFRSIGRFDCETGTLTAADLGNEMYVSEPIYAPNLEVESGGWILSTIYNSSLHRSELWVFDADRLSEEPLARLALPSVVPHGFHGTWQSKC